MDSLSPRNAALAATCVFTGYALGSRPNATMSPETSVLFMLVVGGLVIAFLHWRDRPSRNEDGTEDEDQYGLGLWRPESDSLPADDESPDSRQMAVTFLMTGLGLLAVNHILAMSSGYKSFKAVFLGGILLVHGVAGMLEPRVLAVGFSIRERVNPPWAVLAFAVSVALGFALVWALYFWLY